MCILDMQIETASLLSSNNRTMMSSHDCTDLDASSIVSTSSSESRSVRFQEQLTVIQAQDETPSSLWYQLEDLEVFRTEARELCRQLRSSQSADATSTVTSSSDLELLRDWNSRGLELRSCLERQRRKFLTNRYIVKAARKFDSNKLASFSARCTQWASSLALQEGQRDFERAYPSVTEEKSHAEAAAASAVPVKASLKRHVSDEAQEQDRQVRPRLVGPE